jgi:hypothetical protein
MLDYRYAAKGLIFFTDCNPIITTGGTYCSLLLLIILSSLLPRSVGLVAPLSNPFLQAALYSTSIEAIEDDL